MARPQKNTVDYFPHLIGSGKKITYIENKYGNDGYASWFKILETLASTEYHFLNLNDETELMFLSAKCRVSDDVLMDIINDLVRLKVFDKNLWKKGILWSKTFIDNIEDAYKRRENKCMKYQDLCKHLLSLGIHIVDNNYPNSDNNTQSRVEYIKVEKSIEKKSIKKEAEIEHSSQKKFGKIEFRNELLKNYANPQHVEDWIKVREKKKAAFTETSLDAFLNECQKNNFPISEAVRICAEKSWQGFKYEWIKNLNNGKSTQQSNSDKQQGRNELGNLSENILAAIAAKHSS